ITREASLSARDAFISPSAAITLARASRLASASAAMALWSWRGSFTSLISTLSTLIPQSSVASSSEDCMLCVEGIDPDIGSIDTNAGIGY
uniref:Uncharacterized protein n=2 Tax=Oreochromis TaxID=8139 RepID=A0A669CGY7_ORENI